MRSRLYLIILEIIEGSQFDNPCVTLYIIGRTPKTITMNKKMMLKWGMIEWYVLNNVKNIRYVC